MSKHKPTRVAPSVLGVSFITESISIQILLCAQPGFETQSHFEAPSDLWIKKVSNAVINSGLVMLLPQQWIKVGHGAAK